MLKKLESLKIRYQELNDIIADPKLIKDQKRYKEVMQEFTYLNEVIELGKTYEGLLNSTEETKRLIDGEQDPEMKAMAQEELGSLERDSKLLEQKIQILMVPPDPLDGKDIIMEIRAGTGGDEAALFAADLYRAYSRYAELKGWRVEIISSNEIELGGFKEIVCSISGKSVYADLRYESGVHRVQRVPATESGGRIHTSAITVAVLPEAEEADIEIRNEDLKIDVFRSSGPGGQSVNTTDSAVRITHLPTGVVVTCQDEKSQIKNKAKALRVLRSRLLEAEQEKKNSERAESRKSQVGSGDRSERIRTYNFPQNRMTDHRINLTLYRLDGIMQGDLKEVIESLKLSAHQEALQGSDRS